MNYVHIIDDKMRDSLIEMINYGQSSDIHMAIDILENIDINDKITINNLYIVLDNCPGLDMSTKIENDDNIHFSYIGRRGKDSIIIVNSKSITTTYTRPTS